MADHTCSGCGNTVSRMVGSSCPRCGMPYPQDDVNAGSSEHDLYTVYRPASSSEQVQIPAQQRGEPAGFLAPPVAVTQQPSRDAEEGQRSAHVRAVLPPEPQLRQASPPTPRPSAPARRTSSSPDVRGVRPRSSAPTVVVTVLFGLFGAVAAAVQTSSARGRGLETRRYWKAFGITMLISTLVWVLVLIALFAWLSTLANTA